MREGRSSRKENLFLSDFFWRKFAKENISTQEFFFTTFWHKKKANRNFVLENRKKNPKKRFPQYRAQTKSFFFEQKRILCSHFFKGVFYFVKNRHWKMAKRESLQKRCYKKRKGEKKVVEMRRH